MPGLLVNFSDPVPLLLHCQLLVLDLRYVIALPFLLILQHLGHHLSGQRFVAPGQHPDNGMTNRGRPEVLCPPECCNLVLREVQNNATLLHCRL